MIFENSSPLINITGTSKMIFKKFKINGPTIQLINEGNLK